MRETEASSGTAPTRRRLCAGVVAATAGMAGCIRLTTSGEDGSQSAGGGTGDSGSKATTQRRAADGSEATSRGDTASGGGDPISYDFESEDELSGGEWSVGDELRFTDGVAYAGSSSVGVETGPVDVVAELRPFGGGSTSGRRISQVTYAWWEADRSYGGGIQLLNGDGETEVFAGTNNPEWVIVTDSDPGAYEEVYGGDGYERWVETTVSFNWSAGAVRARFRDSQTGTERERTVGLGAGADVASVRLVPFASLPYEDGEGFHNDSCYMFWDALEIQP